MSEIAFDHVKRFALHLSRAEQMRLAAWLAETLDTSTNVAASLPSRALYGLWADLGPRLW